MIYPGIYGHCTDFPHAQAPDINREVLLLETDNATVVHNATADAILALQNAVDNAPDISDLAFIVPNVTAVGNITQSSMSN